jgi:hypothetical protein
MILDLVETRFINRKQLGMKLLIFMSTIELCEKVADYLACYVSDKGLTIDYFVSGKKDEVLHTTDIVVSTLGKAGTGKDIKNLAQVLCTVALDAKQRNVQVLGRLRELKEYPEVSPEFYYLVCDSIAKHREYHKNKLIAYKPKTKNIFVYRTKYVF